ncbi:uncharacterized protein LOC111908357 [Lactuca sativa]|uniref:uncharacterized protein LOC111908357 n=1 Tax=Lactuca sativa TaxID=4236 RepID=UPI000CAA58B7|nr:uncharacterized protein LOC111908357 [Lactuca sativa]
MAYDQNALPNSLRPIHIARTVGEESRIGAPVVLPNSNPLPREPCTGSPGTIPVYYPSSAPAVPDAGYVNLNYGNAVPAVANWLPRMPPPVTSGGVGLLPGYAYNNTSLAPPRFYDPNLPPVGGSGGGSNASDHASDEGGDDSASGRKVKFLCSFGGKILPRPSDGVLRYVGGDTRIISFRRDVRFNELLQKMYDSYGQNLVIKYQLPDEDLDALVTVSRPDDLVNMMDEYDKLVERSSDGSAKLRVFLFSHLESSSAIRFKDLQDSGQRYVEAVNGITDGFSGGGSSGAGRKESLASASSTQNSESCGTEGGADSNHSIGHDQVEVVAMGPSMAGLSPGGSSAAGVLVGKPVLVSASPSQSDHDFDILERTPLPIHVQQQRQLGYDFAPPGTIQPPSPYLQTYLDPRHGTFNRTEYVQVAPPPSSSQLGYPSQIMRSVAPMYPQPQQIIPSSHVSFKPNPVPVPVPVPVQVPIPVPVPHVVQQQEVQMEQFPVNLSSDQSQTCTTYQPRPQPQPQPPIIPGPYGWNQIPPQDQVSYSDVRVPTQQMIYQEVMPRFDGCIMCQKALPHAHSDTMAQEKKESPRSNVSDVNPVYQSLRLEDARRLMQPNMVPVSGSGPVVDQIQTVGVRSRFADHEGGGMMPPLYAVQGQFGNDGTLSQRPETSYGVLLNQLPHSGHASIAQQQQSFVPMQYQPKQETMVSKRVSGDSNPGGGGGGGGVPSPTSDHSQVHESPKEFPDNVRQIDGRMEELRIRPSPHDVLVNNDIRVENPREEILENRQEVNLDSNYMMPYSYLGGGNSEGSPVFSGVDSTAIVAENPPVSEWNVYPLQIESKTEVEPLSMESCNPFNGVNEAQDTTNSLFSDQDPWMLRHDSQPSGNLELHFDVSHGHSTIGSAEELIKQELQAVAEGVAASVLHSSTPSNPESNKRGLETKKSCEGQTSNTDEQDLKTKVPEKTNLGFPVSDGLGRLQIIKNSDLEELRELGSGTFGTVYHGKWRGTDVAIKRINDRCFAGKASEQERMREDFWNEAIKLADLHHPNVVAFYGVVLDGPGGSVATVTEYMVNGSLRTALQKNERNLDKRKRLLIAMDVAFGMEYLHGKNIVHFDLKSDNLLVNLRDPHRPICKVGDLGLSKVKRQTLISGGVRGTLPWMAPELLNGSSSLVSEKVDVFSFGIVMWELLTGDEPYADLHYGAIIGGIVSNTLRPAVPESCDPEWRSLMERCWSAEPSERPSFTEIANQLRGITSKIPPKGQLHQ